MVFDHVSFTYTGNNEEKALESVSFAAKQGQITAIVGPSGGGKSTIANLISRFWDVTDGKITIGGVDLRDMAQNDLMRQVSFVFQDIFLFKQSILDNIRMGNRNATEEQVIAAAKAAQCHEFISKLPEALSYGCWNKRCSFIRRRTTKNCDCQSNYKRFSDYCAG